MASALPGGTVTKHETEHELDDERSNAELPCDAFIPAVCEPLSGDINSVPPADLQAAYHRLKLLYSLGRTLYAETTPDGVFRAILDAVVKMLSVQRAFVATLADGKLTARAQREIELKNSDEWPVSRTMLSRAIDTGSAILTTDAALDRDFRKARSVDLHGIRSVMCCPLRIRRQPRGVIYVDNNFATGAFDQHDLEFLMALAHYAELAIQNAEERQAIVIEKDLAEARWDAIRLDRFGDAEIVGVSPAMTKVYGQVTKVGPRSVPVLLVGETGVGKEVIAKAIHASSDRARKGPYIAVNVSAISTHLIESELFGWERGAFTGADRRRIGWLELADGGTLFLDEIQEMPQAVQVKLLRVLEERTIERLGGERKISIDIRVVSACNRDPKIAIADGVLRQDLFYRLCGVIVQLPPLRERREDIPALIQHFLNKEKSTKSFDDEAMDCLTKYDWPGNVRELRNAVQRFDVLVDGDTITIDDLGADFRRSPMSAGGGRSVGGFEPLPSLIARVEREHIMEAWRLAEGRNERAIQLLDVSRAKFFQRKKDYGL
jgi:DNA-binding NtrC family response regulator